MKRVSCACCGPEDKNNAGGKEPEIPEQIQKELDAIGGFETLAGRVPDAAHLEKRSRIYHALSDPLRLTILYLIRDQPLCVCIINRFTRLSGSKLSYHLNILKENGLIEGEYHGNWIIYSLADTGREFIR